MCPKTVTTMPTLSTVLFDMDGTLLDTAPDLAAALNRVLKNHRRPTQPFTKIRPLASSGSKGLLAFGFGIDNTHPNYSQLREEFLTHYDQCLTSDTQLFAGIENVLTHIEQRGWRWGVVTNKPSKLARALLTHFKLWERCSCLVGGDHVPNAKPAPDGLLQACKQLAISPKQCIYIGDHQRDVLAAKATNMRTIAVLYGYLPANENPLSWQADYYAKDADEILERLKTAAL